MKILILGGTGVIGSHLANILSDNGDKVVVTSRRRNELKALIEYRHGDAKNIDFLSELLREHWDAIVDFMIYSEDELCKRLDLLLSSTSQYVFLSSARVYNVSQEALTEESARLLDSSPDCIFLATREYSLSKARQEDILRTSNKKNWTIIRPYITYGEKRLQLGPLEKEDWLYRALKGRSIVFSKDISDHLTTLTYSMDVATGIACLVNTPKSLGETYHITNECENKWSDILNIYLDILEEELGSRPKVIYQNLADFLIWNPGKYQIIYDRLFNRKFDNNKINEFINTKKFVQVQLGLKFCLKLFLENPEFMSINWKHEAIKDRYANEKTPLNEINGFTQKLKYLAFRYCVKIR